MFKKLIRIIGIGLVISCLLGGFSLPAHAAPTPHTSYGIVNSAQSGDNWSLYVLPRPTEIQSAPLSQNGGTYYYQAQLGNLPSNWSVGEDSLVFVARETNPGASNHTGYYAVMNEELSSEAVQEYNSCEVRAIPSPTAAAGSGQVNLTWTAAQTDPSETPNGNNIASYNVYRSTSPSTGFSQIGNASGTSHTDSTGTAGTTYYYAIEPVFRGGVALGVYSANSNSIQFPAASPSISVSPSSLTFNAVENGSNPAAQSINITNSGGGTLNWQATENENWLSISPSSGTAPSTLNVSVNIAGLSAGTYNGAINITSPGGNQTVNVTLTVNSAANPNLSVTPTNLSFNAVENGSNPTGQDLNITNSGSGTLTWQATKNEDWLSLSSASGTAPSTLNVSVDITGLSAAGSPYIDTIDITSNGGNQSINITLNITDVISGPSITGTSTDSAYVGQTLTISGSGFGADQGDSTITIGGQTANPISWGDDEIVVAVPQGAAGGQGDIVVSVDNEDGTYPITILTSGVIIDDFEGGCVGNHTSPYNYSGYYVFVGAEDITPGSLEVDAELRQVEAVKHGSYGAKVKYSYVGTDDTTWGGGWGAQRIETIDISGYDTISLYVQWDDSSNNLVLGLKDTDGTAVIATISNASLESLGGYGKITIPVDDFEYDESGSDNNADDEFVWTQVANYNFIYNTTEDNTNDNYHYIDSISAGEVDWDGTGGGTDEPVVPTGEVNILEIAPAAAPAGTRFTIGGNGFGATQGQSNVIFEDVSTGVSYTVDILSWSNGVIEAKVPTNAPKGNYYVKVARIAISADGNVVAYESNPSGFEVTANAPPAGGVTVFPNPFNPLATEMTAAGFNANQTVIAFDAQGATNISIYIYNTNGELVYHGLPTSSQVIWNGTVDGIPVANGLYLIRIVDNDTKSLIARTKLLVIKQ